MHFLKLSRALPEKNLILNYKVANVPYVSPAERFQVNCLDKNICQLTIHYGFMDFVDFVDLPQALLEANQSNLMPFQIDVDSATYLVEIPNVIASRRKNTLLFYWQEKLFAFLMRNYSTNVNIEFYKLSFNRTIAIKE